MNAHEFTIARKEESLPELPPHDLEVEAAALGCLLISAECAKELPKLGLSRRSFYDLRHQLIFDVFTRMTREGKPADLVTIAHELKSQGKLEDAGGLGYLAGLPDKTATAVLFDYYAGILNKLRLRREIIKQAHCLLQRSHKMDEPLETIQFDLDQIVTACKTQGNGLPDIQDAATFAQTKIQPPRELVHCLLHQGSKLVLGGGSKTFKTWTLMDLALSVAMGEPWLSFKTSKGKVLYLNFELADFAFQKRLLAIADAKGTALAPNLIDVWNLRGKAAGYAVLFTKILERIKTSGYSLIILDPIYKCYGDTDENSAGAVAMLMNSIEQLAVDTGAAVAFGAHYAKGNAAGKEAIDRISGSGVFARDPDSILSFTRHETDDAFTVEATLRNFKPIEPFVVRWIYPLMRRDGDLDPKRLKGVNGRKKQHDALKLLTAIESTSSDMPVSISKWSAMAKVDRSTIYEYLPEMVHKGWLGVVGEGKHARRYITPRGISALNGVDEATPANSYVGN